MLHRVLLLLLASTAFASDATECLKTKVWAGYGEGFAVRTMTSEAIAVGETHAWKVTLLPGQTYRFLACAESGTEKVELVLYDPKGWAVGRDDTGREPSFTYATDTLGTYTLVAHPLEVADDSRPAETAVAVTWR